jgi:hypothetical protein
LTPRASRETQERTRAIFLAPPDALFDLGNRNRRARERTGAHELHQVSRDRRLSGAVPQMPDDDVGIDAVGGARS